LSIKALATLCFIQTIPNVLNLVPNKGSRGRRATGQDDFQTHQGR